MSRVREIEVELSSLSKKELKQIHTWISDLLEDELQFTDEFEAVIQQSEREMVADTQPRVRRPVSDS